MRPDPAEPLRSPDFTAITESTDLIVLLHFGFDTVGR